MHVPNEETKIRLTASSMTSAEIVNRNWHLTTVRFAPWWVTNVITVVFSITSLRYVWKKNKTQTKTQKRNRVSNIQNDKNKGNSENRIVNFFIYNEQYDSQIDFSDEYYVAMLELKCNRTPKNDYYNRQYRMLFPTQFRMRMYK